MGKIRSKARRIVPSTTSKDPNFEKDRYIHVRVSNREYREMLQKEAEAEGRSLSNYVFHLIDKARESRRAG